MEKIVSFTRSMIVTSVLLAAQMTLTPTMSRAQSSTSARGYPVTYKTVQVSGLSIFYREAGDPSAPTVMLLHGFPSSSRMYDGLIMKLEPHYHLIAPDYPGFGHSAAPDSTSFDYSFDHIADVVDQLANTLGLHHYSLFMQDYGGPIGFRLALRHPERVTALIVQNAVAHEDGLGPLWATRKAYWNDREKYESDLRKNFLSFATTKSRHIGTDPSVWLYNPDLWTDEFAFLNQPGQSQIQLDLFYDYRTNVALYPKWQEWLRKTQPRLLVLWGKFDPSFQVAEAEAYRRDVPSAQVEVLDAGHFALDTKLDEIAMRVNEFLHYGNKPHR